VDEGMSRVEAARLAISVRSEAGQARNPGPPEL
jgi:hypothetical protein